MLFVSNDKAALGVQGGVTFIMKKERKIEDT